MVEDPCAGGVILIIKIQANRVDKHNAELRALEQTRVKHCRAQYNQPQ